MDKNIKWKDVVGYEGLYKVSEKGDVYSIKREITTAFGGKRFVGGEKKQNKNHEYSTVKLNRGGCKTRHMVHGLVCKAFHKNKYFQGAVVNHKDGNKYNNNFQNLEWVSIGGNQKHAYDTGLRKKITGEQNKSSVLTERKVLEIYDMRFVNKMTFQSIADAMGVTKRSAICICKGITWKHLYEKNKSKI